MDGSTFDHIAQAVRGISSRRRLLGGLTGLGLGSVFAVLETDDASAEKPKDRLQRRTKQHRRKRRNEKRRNQNQGNNSNNQQGKGEVGANACTVCAKGCAFTSVQAALDAATAGDTVTVCPGNYTEDLTFTKNLTLRGLGAEDYPDIAGTKTSSVVTVKPNVTVTIQQIAFGLGIGTPYPDRVGGGVFNQGTLTLSGATFGKCTAERGGGIYNDDGATLFLTNHAGVYDSTATQRGGGLFNGETGQVTIDTTSSLEVNQASEGGGLYNEGTVLLRGGAIIAGNTATASGGGFYNMRNLTVDAAFVQNNTATVNGGGIMQGFGQTTLQNGAVIDRNTAKNGGGVYLLGQPEVQEPGLTVHDSAISRNLVSAGGGGIFNDEGIVTLQAGTVFENTAQQGGGIFNTDGGVVTLDAESTVFENSPNDCIGTSACTA